MKRVLFICLIFSSLIAKSQWFQLPDPAKYYCGLNFPASNLTGIIPVSNGGILYTSNCDGTPGNGNSIDFYLSKSDLQFARHYSGGGGSGGYTGTYSINNLNSSGDSLFSYTYFNLGSNGILLKDSAANYTNLSGPSTIGYLGCATSITPKFVYILYFGYRSKTFDVYRTDRSGKSVLTYSDSLNIPYGDKLQFINDSVGFTLAGYGATNSTSVLLKTTDFGNTWTPVLTASNDPIVDYHVASSGNIYLCKQSGAVSRSIDLGLTWSNPSPAPSGRYASIGFMNDSSGYIGGASGRLYKTTDYAHTWTPETSHTPYTITNIYTFDSIAYFKDTTMVLYKNHPLIGAVAVAVSFYADTAACANVINPSEAQLPVTFGTTMPNLIDCSWDFGDPASGIYNTGPGEPSSNMSKWVGTHSFYTAGTYTVTLTVHTSSGDGSASKVIVIHPTPISSFTSSLLSGNTYQFTSNSTGNITGYRWSFGDSYGAYTIDSTLSTISHTYPNSSNYSPSLIVRNGFGCADTSYGRLKATGIAQLTDNQVFRISPNPSFNGLYTLELTETANETVYVEVANAVGQTILRQESKEKCIRIDLSAEANGLYFLILHQGDKKYQHKLLLAR